MRVGNPGPWGVDQGRLRLILTRPPDRDQGFPFVVQRFPGRFDFVTSFGGTVIVAHEMSPDCLRPKAIRRSPQRCKPYDEFYIHVRALVGWPFITLTDQNGAPFGDVAVGGPIRTARQIEVFHQLRARVQLVGFTSYLDFPICRSTGEPGPDSQPIRGPDISRSCVARCHCFREPGRYLPAGVPAILLPQSDFIDPSMVASLGSPLGVEEGRPVDFDYEYDFVYVCDQGWWKEFAKNWGLARRCLPVLCGELGLRGLLVGRERVDDLPADVLGPDGSIPLGSLTVEPLLPWAELLQRFRRSRMVFVASGMDPSPRAMGEALALDTPILVNQEILGGWH